MEKKLLEGQALSSSIVVNDANFEKEILMSSVPVLLDFWASWCMPCRMIGPFIDQLAQEYEGRLKVGKINVDEDTELAGRHSVVSIPTLVVYKDGKIVNQAAGAFPKQNIEALFKDFL
jgi:thioredoxin 1